MESIFQENEINPLYQKDIIQLYDSGPKRMSILQFIKKYNHFFFLFLIIIVLLFTNFFNSKDNKDNEKYSAKYNGNIINLLKSIEIIELKVYHKKKESKKKIQIGFLFPRPTQSIVNIGEYLVKTEKYNVYFLAKLPFENGLIVNKNITITNAFNFNTTYRELIANFSKNQNLDYLILNGAIDFSEIQWLKSLELKLIGFLEEKINKKLELQNLELFDAIIESTNDKNNISDYYEKKIFIPNIYKPLETNLDNNHNIVILGKFQDENNGLGSIIKTLRLIIEKFHDSKIYIFSSNNEKLELNKLIKDEKLDNNIIFPPSKDYISSYLKNSSIFLYTTLEEEYPYILYEAISYGVSCITFSNILNSLSINNGIFTINVSNQKKIKKEINKLFNDNNYRKKKVEKSRLSLEKFNQDIANLWDQLFISLKDGQKEFQQLKNQISKNMLLTKYAEKTIYKLNKNKKFIS